MGYLSMKKNIVNKIKSGISTALAIIMVMGLLPLRTGISVYAEEEPYVELTNTLTAQDTFAWTEYDHDNSVRAIAVTLARKVSNREITKTTGGKIDSSVVTVAVDISTGKIYMGLSNRKNGNPTYSGEDNVCSFISERVSDVCNKYNCTIDLGLNGKGLINCGEYNAINNAINDGSLPENLYVYSVVKKEWRLYSGVS